jgi:diacylglycerol kinase (ATP)
LSKPPANTGMRRIVAATRCSAEGFGHAWKYEAAFRQEIALTLILAPVALWLGQDYLERLLLIGSCLLVLIVELLNSAVEAAVDRIGGEHHVLSGRAKDLGSAAVFVSLIVVGAVWATIGLERFLS